MDKKWYEIHSSIDGHVGGYGDRDLAEARADELEREFGHTHTVREVGD